MSATVKWSCLLLLLVDVVAITNNGTLIAVVVSDRR